MEIERRCRGFGEEMFGIAIDRHGEDCPAVGALSQAARRMTKFE
jgi:hypothetical protein